METIELGGFKFRVAFEHDADAGYPWDDAGRGSVRQSNYAHNEHNSDKRPGERPLNQADRRETQFYYDWQAACKTARAEHWNSETYDAQDRVARAVQSDFDYLRGFVNNDWSYVFITVTMLDDDGEAMEGYSDSLSSVETYKDHHENTAQEMAGALAAQRVEDLISENDADKKETAELTYWEQRDVVTA
jgi:hypothetical protein